MATFRRGFAIIQCCIASFIVGCAGGELPTATSGQESLRFDRAGLAETEQATGYIVRLKEGPGRAAERASEISQIHGGLVSHTFERVFKGFVIEGISASAAENLRGNPLVISVEKDVMTFPTGTQTLTLSSQWGLDWIDQRSPPLNNQYTYPYSGAGVHVYIVDSGIRGDHVEFTGRMGNGFCLAGPWWNPACTPYADDIGHGTSVASQAAGTVAGVAKGATIHSVRIDQGPQGAPDSDIIAGLEWIVYNNVRPAVVNISYGDTGEHDGTFALQAAIQRIIDIGIVVSRSAGNANRDAFQYRPNRVNPAFIVAAAGWSGSYLYRRADSNFGSLVDIYAPGNFTYAGTSVSSTSYGTFGATSGATPFVTGAVAQILEAYSYLTPAEVDYWIKANSTSGVMTGLMAGDPNLFLDRW